MTEATLADLLARNDRHVASLDADYFADVLEAQTPPVVSICCADSRVSQEGMWAVDEPGYLFTPSTIGNQVWDRANGDRVLDGSVGYPLAFTDTSVAAVVGHTGCGAVTAALEAVEEQRAADARADPYAGSTKPPGVEKWIEMLVPVIEAGLADDRVDPAADAALVDQLVEYNVDRQVAFLRAQPEVPEDAAVYGFVYDFQGVYGDVPGRAYLVNADGETDPAALAEGVPDDATDHVARLL